MRQRVYATTTRRSTRKRTRSSQDSTLTSVAITYAPSRFVFSQRARASAKMWRDVLLFLFQMPLRHSSRPSGCIFAFPCVCGVNNFSCKFCTGEPHRRVFVPVDANLGLLTSRTLCLFNFLSMHECIFCHINFLLGLSLKVTGNLCDWK